MNNFLEIKKKIQESKNILITSHVNPDGDAIGSGLALMAGIKKLNREARVRFVLQDKTPDRVNFLALEKGAEIYDPTKEYIFDLVICVDSADLSRVGIVKELIKDSYIINIDHHITNPLYANLNYVEEISSTSEIIYNFLRYCSVEIDIDMGEALYTGLVNDTGNFKHDNVSVKTFEMAGYLRGLGVNNSKVVREFWDRKSLAAIKLLGQAMYEMEFYPEKKMAYFFLSYEDMKKVNGRKEDTEDIVEKLISYEEAEISLFLREDKPGVIKGSMRSKHKKNVNTIAESFGGGGHKKAAGFTSELPPQEILKLVLEKL